VDLPRHKNDLERLHLAIFIEKEFFLNVKNKNKNLKIENYSFWILEGSITDYHVPS
jgi:hypothetical protein